MRRPATRPDTLTLEALELSPREGDSENLYGSWTPGESGARTELKRFLETGIRTYATDRDFPARAGTSRLSPHLHWGEISPRMVWRAAETVGGAAAPFQRQLI